MNASHEYNHYAHGCANTCCHNQNSLVADTSLLSATVSVCSSVNCLKQYTMTFMIFMAGAHIKVIINYTRGEKIWIRT